LKLLTSFPAKQWFEALGVFDPGPEQLRRIQRIISSVPLTPHLRAILQHDDKIVGRIAARAEEYAVRFWIPDFRAGISHSIRLRTMEFVLESIKAMAVARGLKNLPLETWPGSDLPENDLWLEVLRRHGFSEISSYQIYALSLSEVGQSPGKINSRISFRKRPDDAQLAKLYSAVSAHTLERRELHLNRPVAYLEDLKRIGTEFDPNAWLVASLDGADVGFALANYSEDEGFPGRCAWLVELGCAPEHRRTGVASSLMAELIRELQSHSCQWLLATIDDRNTPSIALHLKLGFRLQPGHHYVYRLDANVG
jgi:GNAT superfamily N-acetyltransferase